MTLGGMSLAVGILVDDATVEIENVHRNMAHEQAASSSAILDGAAADRRARRSSRRCASASSSSRSSSSPARRSRSSRRSAMAVVFAMLTSYFLSRTLVPTMVHYLLDAGGRPLRGRRDAEAPKKRDIIWRIHERFNVGFERLRTVYGG